MVFDLSMNCVSLLCVHTCRSGSCLIVARLCRFFRVLACWRRGGGRGNSYSPQGPPRRTLNMLVWSASLYALALQRPCGKPPNWLELSTIECFIYSSSRCYITHCDTTVVQTCGCCLLGCSILEISLSKPCSLNFRC